MKKKTKLLTGFDWVERKQSLFRTSFLLYNRRKTNERKKTEKKKENDNEETKII